jgi:NADPH-dependent glutamate synthase beta subunit-like oxidoreductase/bacterioferritin-associated ferredoxin
MALAEEDKWDEALDLLESTNPLPGVTGRVCNSPCEGACNRGHFDQPLSIRAVERALADHAARRGRRPGVRRRKRRERVAVVGAGPAGLSCAYHLARQGFPVTVFEQAPEIGGILRYGIPRYRLPADVLDQEVASIGKMGVDFKVNQRLDGNIKLRELEKYDALFLAMGLPVHRKPDIAGKECAGVMAGLYFLERVSKGEPPEIGRRVLVVGGGNSAVDSARSALRLGARPTLVYRRRETDMPALASEIEDLKAEGIDIVPLTAPVRFINEKGVLTGVECIKMEAGGIDGDGRIKPVPVRDSQFTIPADTVIYCIGETGDFQWAPEELIIARERIEADRWGRTSMKKVFAGGDVAGGPGTVAGAIGQGRRSAAAIAAYLKGELEPADPEVAVVEAREMSFDYLDPSVRLAPPRLSVERAVSTFEEIHCAAKRDEYLSESGRCLHCGVSPDFSPEYCRGCSNCTSRCPAYAISIVELEKPYVVKVDVEDDMIGDICRICEKAIIHPESLACQCTGTRASEIVAAILKGAKTVVDIRRMTGAHTGCGSACISPIFRLMKAAGLDITSPPQPELYYPSAPEIWDIPEHVIRDFEARGFRFREDKEFLNEWHVAIRAYCEEKERK